MMGSTVRNTPVILVPIPGDVNAGATKFFGMPVEVQMLEACR